MGKAKYKLWVESDGNSADPVVIAVGKLLPKIILDFVIKEDITGPSCRRVVREQYQKELERRLREPVTKAIRFSGLVVTDDQLNKICTEAAGEAFVVRGLNEARLMGEISLRDIEKASFYRSYREYFEQSPEIIIKAFEVATDAALAPPVNNENN